MKHLKLFEGISRPPDGRKGYSTTEVEMFKKITEMCEEYVADIIDECRSNSILTTSYTRSDRKGYEWTFIIRSYYPVKIEQICKKMSVEFDIINWWVESSGTSSLTSETENRTVVTIQLNPKFNYHQ